MRLFILLIFLYGTLGLQAQDPTFSQFYANRPYLNPAFIGINEGLTFTSSYRHQWPYLAEAFKTIDATVELQQLCLNSGFSLSLFQHTEGEGSLQTTAVRLGYSYTLYSKKSNFHFGLQVSGIDKRVDWSKFRFSDQIDPFFGFVDADGVPIPTTAFPSLENRLIYPDVDFGILWRRRKRKGNSGYSGSVLGLTLRHLTRPIESLQPGLCSKTPIRLTLHGGLRIFEKTYEGAKGRIFYLLPNFRIDVQGLFENNNQNSQCFTANTARTLSSSLGMYIVTDNVFGGIFYQNKTPLVDLTNINTVIFMIGFEVPFNDQTGLSCGLSYDINATGLSTEGGGAWELTARFNIAGDNYLLCRDKRTSTSNKRLDCPKWGGF